MSSARHKPMTVEAFLAWEARQEERYEFDGIAPVAMTGARLSHEVIVGNVRGVLHARLAGSACRAFGPTAKVIVDGRVRYPDAIVTCAKQDYTQAIVSEPLIVFEVVSPSTAHTDRILKLREYQRTPSIQRYVILEQDTIGATVFARRGDLWTAESVGTGGTLALPEAGIEWSIDACYAGLDMPPVIDPDEPTPA